MKHASNRELFDYWNERRGSRPAPDRSEIEPGAIRRILADTFILAYDTCSGHPFRVAGTRVCAAFGRELKGEAFGRLWSRESQTLVGDLLTVVGRESVGVVAGVCGQSSTDELDLELILLPLRQQGHTTLRILGALVPVETPYWLGTSPLGSLTLGTLRYLNQGYMAAAPDLVPALPTGRMRRGFRVYDGGQS